MDSGIHFFSNIRVNYIGVNFVRAKGCNPVIRWKLQGLNGKNYGGYRPEELPKIENNAGQTDLEKQKQYWRSRKANQNRILINFRENQGYLKKN